MPTLFERIAPIALLTCSNVFMTFTWYGHVDRDPGQLGIALRI
jgi:uncharacterized protein (DUF486 family)